MSSAVFGTDVASSPSLQHHHYSPSHSKHKRDGEREKRWSTESKGPLSVVFLTEQLWCSLIIHVLAGTQKKQHPKLK